MGARTKTPGLEGASGHAPSLGAIGARSSDLNRLQILVLAPTSNDGQLSVEFLRKARLEAKICLNIAEICEGMAIGCGALLFAEEVLVSGVIQLLVDQLSTQPSWSDLPIIIVTGIHEIGIRRRSFRNLESAGNITVIEKPVRPETLVSVFEAALRSRRRQYQVRALLEERDAMTAKAEQQARIFDTTLSSIPDFTYIFAPSGAFSYANKALLDLWGLKLDQVIGKTFFELPYSTALATTLHGQVLQVFKSGEILRDETPYTNADGITGYYEYIFSPVRGEDGKVEVVAGSTRETSARRRGEEALRRADRRKDEFLAMLAHELRNPLASVANAAALILSGEGEENRVWAAEVIARQTRQLAHLIDDLLDVSRISTGKIRLRKSRIDLAAILDRAIESACPLIEKRQHQLASTYLKNTLWLEADPTRIEQIVLNLLTNAAKYTPLGGQIKLTARRVGAQIQIVVKDNGIGICDKQLPEVFHLFSQGERSIARSEGGLGIGLTIVKKLTEMHGGQVIVASEGLNRGSTFTIQLPCAPAPAASEDKKFLSGQAARSESFQILIVDDNIDSAQGLGRLLKRAGHRIEIVDDGPQALDQFNASNPDAIVLDIGLPGMDGFEVVRQIRAQPGGSAPLIIAVTGYGQPKDRERALRAGFNHHLVKPVNVDELKSILNAELSKQIAGPTES